MGVHHCGAENAPNAKFCKKCGEKLHPDSAAGALTSACPQCGLDVNPGARFCGHCGHHLVAAADKRQANAESMGQAAVAPAVVNEPDSTAAGSGDVPADALRPAAHPPTAPEGVHTRPAADQSLPSNIHDPSPGSPETPRRTAMAAGVLVALLVTASAGGAWWYFNGSAATPASVEATAPRTDPPIITVAANPPERARVEAAPELNAAKEETPVAPVRAPVGGAETSAPATPAPAATAPRPATPERRVLTETRRQPESRQQQPQQQAAVATQSQAPQQREGVTAPPPPSPAAQPALPTVPQLCAEKKNFISRAICEERACVRAEYSGSRYCTELRARQAQNDPAYSN